MNLIAVALLFSSQEDILKSRDHATQVVIDRLLAAWTEQPLRNVVFAEAPQPEMTNGTVRVPTAWLASVNSPDELACLIALESWQLQKGDGEDRSRLLRKTVLLDVYAAQTVETWASSWPLAGRERALDAAISLAKRAGYSPVGMLTYLERRARSAARRNSVSFGPGFMSLPSQVRNVRERLKDLDIRIARSTTDPEFRVRVAANVATWFGKP